jgi:MSHA biogenesis protein MshG
MPGFACRTRDGSGKVVERTIEAASRSAALKLLEGDGLFPVKITEVGRPAAATPSSAGESTQAVDRRIDRRCKRKELLHFSLQLSSALSAGVPLLGGLGMIRKQTGNPAFRAVLEGMAADIEGGLSLSGSMKRYPRTFPAVYTRTVAAGEQSGSVDPMLNNLAEYLEAEMEVLSSVRSALLYPAIVVSTLCLAITVLVLFVVPRFTEFYSRFDTELPLPTRILIFGSHLVQEQGVWILCALAAFVVGCVRFVRSRPGKGWLDRVLLRIPVIGGVIETAITLRVVQIFGLSAQAGLPMLESLELIAGATTNTKIAGHIRRVAAGVLSGETLADSMEAADCFPPSARQMLASGETTGSLERSCFAVAKHYKKELHYSTKNLATFIEPLLTLVLAAVVLFVALAVFLPMWNMVKVVQQ